MGPELSADVRDGAVPDSLVVVSNREPYSHERDDEGEIRVQSAAGGLTSALDPVMQSRGGTWVAWASGDADMAVAEDGIVGVPPSDPVYDLKRVPLSEAAVQGYYYGYANQVLWPLCHEDTGRMWAEPAYWEQYRAVNEQFAEAVDTVADAGQPVWFQDYHLALAPRLVRERRPDATLLQFWHIPWPAPSVFSHCPHSDALLDGLLACDVIGFHTAAYAEQFLRCVDSAFPAATVDIDTGGVTYNGSETRAVANPLGVDVEAVRDRARAADVAAIRDAVLGDSRSNPSIRLALGVERLDYSKGIPERIEALAHLWERRPDLRGAFTYVQKASRTREGIAAYRRYRSDVLDAVERVNDRFGTDDWQPIVYTEAQLDNETLAGLYRAAAVAVVTPHRDGMNLVAHEYPTACVDGDGALVLSDLAGAATHLDGALTVNPHDIAGIADAVEAALELDAADARDRLERLQDSVAALDSSAWVARQFSALK
ncbi:trehalose-6-phosphate synthase [Haloarcula sp. S1AR25-5A]|uniref:Trehalose-6-phosphate synthase n=1 Tax=Haloarcula terrestris TaxID=2950533 RepID=A0AAE4EYR2_9EURY|nr:trehalose-6-phosphate synthase [Haloarcula terrestris]MDS0222593.1 trehalose-6-phosphate synthase [Haloarcula terrestris]